MGQVHWINRLAAVAAALVGVFLVLGGTGHLNATWSTAMAGSPQLLIPGIILCLGGLFNLWASMVLWRRQSSLDKVALGVNIAVFAYLGVLMWDGVPDHPISSFTVVVGLFLALLLFSAMKRPRSQGA